MKKGTGQQKSEEDGNGKDVSPSKNSDSGSADSRWVFVRCLECITRQNSFPDAVLPLKALRSH